MANTHIRFQDEDDSEYNVSDSDNDYTEKEKDLLQKVRNRKDDYSDSDDEVYAVGSDGDDESGKSDLAVSDVEGQDDDDDLPDIRAWGKDKRKFYSTDYIDPDYGGFEGKSATLAELEEEEAKNLQKQLVQELDDGDFSLDMFVQQKKEEAKEELEEIVKTDVSKLSNRQKLQLLKKDSPEFFKLVDDFKAKMSIAKDTLKPVLDLSKDGKIKDCEALEFVKLYYQLILNYSTNICMYVLLKASKMNLKNHPIVKRLLQYKQHLSQMDAVYDEIILPQLEVLISTEERKTDTVMKKTLQLLTKLKSEKDKNANAKSDEEGKKHVKFADVERESTGESSDTEEDIEMKQEEKMDVDNEDNKATGEKRAITYKIAKNKGLTPRRKKEQRNPRVKHRNKFKKAKVRRKGAVREVRRELSKYSGEISGIKASVTKSIKIKG